MNIEFIKSPEKKRILEKLNEEYGIENLPFLLIRSGKDKIRAYSGNLSKDEIAALAREIIVESIGIYLLSEEENNQKLRLGFDTPTLLDVKKNIVEISDESANDWLSGKDITVSNDIYGFVVLKNNEDLIGCGKASNGMIKNFVPKERRRKN